MIESTLSARIGPGHIPALHSHTPSLQCSLMEFKCSPVSKILWSWILYWNLQSAFIGFSHFSLLSHSGSSPLRVISMFAPSPSPYHSLSIMSFPFLPSSKKLPCSAFLVLQEVPHFWLFGTSISLLSQILLSVNAWPHFRDLLISSLIQFSPHSPLPLLSVFISAPAPLFEIRFPSQSTLPEYFLTPW